MELTPGVRRKQRSSSVPPPSQAIPGELPAMVAKSMDLPTATQALFAHSRPTPSDIYTVLVGTRAGLAQKLRRDRAVLGWLSTPVGVAASVAGSSGAHTVRIPHDRLLEAICGCQDFRRQGLLCKHGGAALLEAFDAALPGAALPV